MIQGSRHLDQELDGYPAPLGESQALACPPQNRVFSTLKPPMLLFSLSNCTWDHSSHLTPCNVLVATQCQMHIAGNLIERQLPDVFLCLCCLRGTSAAVKLLMSPTGQLIPDFGTCCAVRHTQLLSPCF